MKILIAYDGSQGADDALDDLARAGLPPLAEALIVSVAEVFAPPAGPGAAARPVQVPLAVRKAWAEATQAVEAARERALQGRARVQALFPGWQVRAEAVADSPAWGVIKQADEIFALAGRFYPGYLNYRRRVGGNRRIRAFVLEPLEP